MDLISVVPVFNLYNARWPILTLARAAAAGQVRVRGGGRTGRRSTRIVCAGVIVSGGRVRRSILSPGVRVHSYAEVDASVLLHGVDVGRNADRAQRDLDKHVQIGGACRSASTRRPTASASPSPPGGIVVIGKGEKVEAR